MNPTNLRIGAIDIGTNSVHLRIAEVDPDGSIQILESDRVQVELGAGSLEKQALTPEAMERGVAAMERFHEVCTSFGVTDVHATATSAVREAQNGNEFCKEVRRRTDIHVRIIAGLEEARLIYLGARADLDFSRGRVVIFDLGGGSTEFILCDAETALVTQSLRLGHIRLAEAFHHSDPIAPAEIDEMITCIREKLAPLRMRIGPDDFGTLVGTSGTARALAHMATLRRGDITPQHKHGLVLLRTDLDALIEVFRTTPARQMSSLPGMDAKRVRTLPTGAILVAEIMDALGATQMVTSERSLRDGLIADWVIQHRPEIKLLGTVSDPRRRAVIAAMERFRVDEGHGRQVARFALKLFDATALLHGLRIDDRRMLEFASLLHDIGHHIGAKDHQKHGQYLLKHTRMPGFTAPEIGILSTLVRWHRTGQPKRKDPDFVALPAAAQHRVTALSALLAMADALDRGHNQNVEHLDVELTDDHVLIRASTSHFGDLERWAAIRRSEPLARVLGRKVEIAIE